MMEFARNAKSDGFMALVSSATNYFPVLLGDKAAKYDFRQWKPMLVNPVGGVMYTSPDTGIKRIEDLAKAKNLIYGGISAIGLDLIPLISFELLDMDAKGVLGFKGRGDARIAFERGETNLDYQTTPAYNATVVPLIKEGKAIPLMSFGQLDDSGNIVRDPAVPDLPTVPEVYEKLKGKKPSGRFWETYKVFMPSAFAVQKILWVKADVPAEVPRGFYTAVDLLEKDKAFLAKTDKILGGYSLLRGDRLEKTIQQPSLEERAGRPGDDALPQEEIESLRDSIWAHLHGLSPSPTGQIVVTTTRARARIRALLAPEFPDLPVLARAELQPGVRIQQIGTIATRA